VIVLRSWPAEVPPSRARVVDDIPRYVMREYDYRGMFDEADDDLLIIEWDIAVGAEHFDAMRDLIASEPDAVHAAPYRIYTLKRDRGPHWVMRRLRDDDPDDISGARWVTEGDTHSHLFGFGMTYIPRALWQAYKATVRGRDPVNDTRFSKWHHDHVRAEVPIPWHIQPVHLHFPLGQRIR